MKRIWFFAIFFIIAMTCSLFGVGKPIQQNDQYYENLVSTFSKQTSSERDPLRMCFPTSMVNAGLCCQVQFPKRVVSKYTLLEDVYDVVKMPFSEFWHKTQRTATQHVGIIFKCSNPKSAEYDENVRMMYSDFESNLGLAMSSREYASLPDRAKSISVMYLSNNQFDKYALYVGTDPEETQGIPASSWYLLYLDYMINAGFESTVEVISYSDYLTIASIWSDLIPKHFLFPMINESLKQNVPLNQIYAIAKVETLNFRFFESLKTNSNGTSDYGIMGLNSANFDTTTWHGKDFLNKYFYYDNEYQEFDPNNQLHMLKICVHYLKYLIDYTGSFKDAAICYNGGLTKWINNIPVEKAIEYSTTVTEVANTFATYEAKNRVPVGLVKLYLQNADETGVQTNEIDTVYKNAQFSFDDNTFICYSYYCKNGFDITLSYFNLKECILFKKEDPDLEDVEISELEGTFIGTLSTSGNFIILS